MTTLEDAQVHVGTLDEFPQQDNQHPIEAASTMVHYVGAGEPTFTDINAYTSERFPYHNEEFKLTARLVIPTQLHL